MSVKNIFGNSFTVNQEINIVGKKTELKSKGENWPNLTLEEVATPTNISAMIPAALGAIPTCSGSGRISQELMAVMGAVSTAGTVMVTQNQNTGQYTAEYILSLMKVMNGAYAKGGNLSEEELKKLIMFIMGQMLEKAGPGFSNWNQVLKDLMQNATLDNFMKGVQSAVCALIGDPVNANTGNFIYEKDDIEIKALVPLMFKRTYNRIDNREGCMGRGWRHNYEIELITGDDRYIIVWEDGREEIYMRLEDGGIDALFGCICRLEKNDKGFSYKTQQGIVYIFNQQGHVLSRTDANGKGIFFTYGRNGKLECVLNGSGIMLNYKYDSISGRLISVSDHTGRNVELSYELGRLCRVTNAGGESYSYYYDDEKMLYRIQNPRGVFVLENNYDDQGRTVCQHFADGGKIHYDYQEENSRTLVTDQNNNKVAYIHDERFRNAKTVYEDGEEEFIYNERNQIIRYTDKNRNQTRYSYDNKGNVSKVIYPDGSQSNMTYDADNHLLTWSVNGVEKLKNVYDTKGNLIKTSDALNRKREFEYDSKGNVLKVKLPDGSAVFLEYDNGDNIIGYTDESGRKINYEYDDCNRVIRTLDGNRNCISFTYDNCDRIACVTNAQGKQRIYEYTKNGKVERIIDFNGAVISQNYNCMNMVDSYIGPDGEKFIMEYDKLQNVTRRILPNGGELGYTYDSLNRMKEIALPTGGIIHYEYDPNGNRTAVTDPNGNRTVMEYDERNRITKITDPSGAATMYEYDMEGLLIGITNAMGKSHTYVYDEAGQLVNETDVMGNKTSYEYNELGKCICMTDPEKRQTIYEYAKGGDLSKIIFPDGTSEAYLYDENGNLIRRQNHKGDFLEITYDCLNQPIKVRSSFGQEKSYTYNAVGKATSMTDPLGHVTHYEYSPGGKLTSVIDAAGNRTEYAYDGMGELITICQHEGKGILLNENENYVYDKNQVHVTQYERNLLGKVETITNPLGLKEHFTYDLAGKMSSKKDREGYKTQYTYNPQGEIEQVIYANGRSVEFAYNPLRQLIEIKDWLGTMKIEPDEVGRAKKVIDYKGREFSYQWGISGERKSLTYPDGRTVSYEYDELVRLSRLTDGEREIRYSYNENGYLSEKTFSDGITTNYGYNSVGQLSMLVHQQDGRILDQHEYDYDLMGNKISIKKMRQADVPLLDGASRELSRKVYEESGFYQYQYDSMNRLTEVIKDRECISQYEYDTFGNRIRKKESTKNIRYHYNEANQLIREEGIFPEPSYRYDGRGNLTSAFLGQKEINRYIYDETNRLSAAFNNKGQATKYEYNGLGNRVERQEFFASDLISDHGFQPEMILKEQPGREVDYLLDLTKNYDNLLGMIETSSGCINSQTYIWDNNVALMTEREHEYIFLQDELGSISRLIGINDKQQIIYGYDEFGQDLYKNQGEVQPFGYTGYQSDSIANTYFAQAREYLPGIGRFAGEDAIKGWRNAPITFNLYSYTYSSPLVYIDPNGETAAEVLRTGMGIAGATALSDTPAPGPMDAVAAVIAGATLIVAGGIAVYEWVGSKEKAKEERSVAIADTAKNNSGVVIYRYGSGNATNLTPREVDISGLSYSLTTPPAGVKYTMTTIDAVNSTRVLTAIVDGPNHVSVRPTNTLEMPVWINSRTTALENPYYLTTILSSISIKNNGGPCNGTN
jgi:RHS repeat-associated protein